ncbi:MAG: hypothetical protein KF819_16220 [Labilithrix sp.]|nr:hypothetical protein [Labilithrix sp.]
MKKDPTNGRTCYCGHRRGDPAIHEEPEYSMWGWIVLSMFGVTPRPHHIAFRCAYCREELGQSRDPRLLARRTTPRAA